MFPFFAKRPFLELVHLSEPVEKVVILIHGTFARDPDWCRSGTLVDECSSIQNCSVFRFKWSGWLTLGARNQAAECLAQSLFELRQTYPHAILIMLGHSHGGNVAITATHCNFDLGDAALICLSTPFIDVASFEEKWSPFVAVMVCFGIVLEALGLTKFLNRHADGGPSVGWLVLAGSLYLGIATLFVWTRFNAQSIRCLLLPEPAATVRTLIVLGTGDEAGAFLNSTSLVMLLASLISRWSIWLILAPATLVPTFLKHSSFSLKMFAQQMGLAAGIVLVMGSAYLLILALIDWRICVVSMWYRISVEVIPSGRSEALRFVTLRKGLRHSALYTEPSAVRAIGDWIRKLQTNPF